MPHREIVEDLSGQCQPGYCTLYEVLKLAGIDIPAEVQWTGNCRVHGCPLKDHVLRSGLRDRDLEELKCIEIFKYDRSLESWDEASRLWIEQGYHHIFREVYLDGMKHGALYDKIMNYPPAPG